MRLNNILIASVSILLGLSSCMKEEMSLQDGQVMFSARFSESSTKTSLQGMTPYWSPSDMISIYDGENNMFENTGDEMSAKTSFMGKLAGKGRKYYLAAYPYGQDLSFAFLSKTVYGLQMPAAQKAAEGTYDPAAAAAISYTEDFNLSFRNVCSLIRFRIISDGVTSVTVQANAGEYLAGKFNATWSDSPSVTVTAGEKAVTLEGDFKKDSTYFITTVPMVLTEGLTVTLNDEVVTMKETSQVNLARSGMVNIGDLSLDPSESVKPSDPDPSPDPSGKVIYLNAGGSSLWDQADAWFEVWSWATGADGAWYTMTSVGSGVYQCTVSDTNSNIIFVRRGPGMTQGWDAEVHYWNKTDDLAIPSGMNCYTVTGWGGADGTWSVR